MRPARVGFFPALYIACTNVSANANPYVSPFDALAVGAYFPMMRRYSWSAGSRFWAGFDGSLGSPPRSTR